MRRSLPLPLLLLLPWLAACAGCPDGTAAATVAEALFGRNLAGTPRVSDAEWDDFLAREAAPRLPDGLTVIDAAGQWRDPAGRTEREASKLLIVLLPGTDLAAARDRLDPLARAYAARFGQQSVLTSYRGTCAAF